MPPVLVPATRSNTSAIRLLGSPDSFCSFCSKATSTCPGMIPRMPPPSMERIRIDNSPPPMMSPAFAQSACPSQMDRPCSSSLRLLFAGLDERLLEPRNGLHLDPERLDDAPSKRKLCDTGPPGSPDNQQKALQIVGIAEVGDVISESVNLLGEFLDFPVMFFWHKFAPITVAKPTFPSC